MVEKEVPKAGRGAIVTKIRLCNICGSDIKEWAGLGNLVKPGCVGHEFVSEILDLGEGVTTDYAGTPVAVGDRIVGPYYLTCMKCSKCAEGDFANCENGYVNLWRHPDEWPHFHGAFASHYYFHPNNVFYKVPDDLDDQLVVGANCALTQVYAGLDKIDVRYGETMVIQGAGGLGLYATSIANEMGAIVTVIDNVKERLELAKRLGAAYTVDMTEYPAVEDRVKAILKITEGKGADCAVEVTGYPQAFEEGLRYLKVGGRYMTMGNNVIGKEATVSPAYITRKALSVYGIVRYKPVFLLKALKFLQRTKDKYPFMEISSEIYPLDDIQSIMEQSFEHKITRAALEP
jgi:threonine dehydrogenase-like Zn-dependent dehydrogenase